jgi:hypothetical protein
MNGGNGAVPLGEELSHGLGEFLSRVSDCESLEIIALERLSGGAVQENYALDVHFGSGTMAIWTSSRSRTPGANLQQRIVKMNKRFARDIRNGIFDGACAQGVQALLMDQVRARLRISNPSYLRAAGLD